MKTTKDSTARWIYLSLATLSMLGMGAIYSWSIIKVPLADTFGWTSSQLSLAYSLTISFFCIGNLLTHSFTRRLGVRGTLLLCSVLCGAGYFAIATASRPGIWQCYLYYSFFVGGSVGIAYNALLSTLSNWFYDKTGTCSGILMMGFGLSTLLWGNVLSYVFELSAMGWRIGYAALGAFVAVILAICALVVRPAAPSQVSAAVPENKKSHETFPLVNFTPREILRRRSFWLFYFYGIFAGAAGGTVIAFAYDLCRTLGAPGAVAAMLVGIYSACNGVSRVVVGILYDRVGRRWVMQACNLVTLSGTMLMLAALLTGSLALGAVALCFIGVSYGFGPVINASFTKTFYGPEHFSTNFGLGNTKVIVSSFVAPLTSAIFGLTGSYTMPFVMLTGFALLAFALNAFIREP